MSCTGSATQIFLEAESGTASKNALYVQVRLPVPAGVESFQLTIIPQFGKFGSVPFCTCQVGKVLKRFSAD